LKKEIQGLSKIQLQVTKQDLVSRITKINGIDFLAAEVDLDGGMMKDLAFSLGQNNANLCLVLGSKKGDKAVLSCYISKELVANSELNAGNIVRTLGKYIQGGGGGQPFFATAGGKNPEGVSEALKAARDLI